MVFIDTQEMKEEIESACLGSFLAHNYLFNKKLCLVGGSLRADKIVPDFFKQFDIVVQLNHHILRRKRQPVDWWICRSSPPIVPDDIKVMRKCPTLVSSAVNTNKFLPLKEYAHDIGAIYIPFHETAFIRMNPYHSALEWCNAFWNEVDTNPLIGMLALRMILNYPIQSVMLTGFDFYEPDNGGFRPMIGPHHLKNQRDWLSQTWHCDHRVIFDKKLIKVLRLNPEKRSIGRFSNEPTA